MYTLKKTITEKEFQFTIRDKQAKNLHKHAYNFKYKTVQNKIPSLKKSFFLK